MNISTIKHILAALFLLISTFTFEVFGFICFFLAWCNRFGDAEISALDAIIILLIPHLVLLLLNILFIYVLNKGLSLSRIFYKTFQGIAIILFVIPWCIILFAMIKSAIN